MSQHCDSKVLRPLRTAAEYFVSRGRQLIRTSSGTGALSFVQACTRLSEIYDLDNRWVDSFECMKQSGAACVQSKQLTTMEKTTVLFQIGKPLVERLKYEESIPFLEQAIPYARLEGNYKNILADELNFLSAAYMQTGRINQAIATKRELADTLDQIGSHKQAQDLRKEIEKLTPRIK